MMKRRFGHRAAHRPRFPVEADGQVEEPARRGAAPKSNGLREGIFRRR
jgi:hypothetical protein